ncbi:MAG: type ISP restriction/modification enzyme, partial [Mariprofundaceae bacterium]|nr:type ISP restriction/modification enzyme [Mariprofundaceae bacterium]
GAWSGYVDEHLIPRLNGFELLMASYAMAHLKLDLLLRETGFKATKEQRLNIYLTNSLEEHHPDTGTLFSSWLSSEANEANHIKRDTPVMVVMGNPPYSVSSSNKSQWIQELLADYKKDLNEKNIQPLSDDYIKFIRYGQHFIEKNGEGILAYISNNSFIDGVIHRQMRKYLLESFDKIYILDLHGNSKKKETTPDGSKDENVFDIMQGVSINIFVKHKKKSSNLADVYHLDLYGKRNEKYQALQESSLASFDWNKLDSRAPGYFFIEKDFNVSKKYDCGYSVNELFVEGSSGIQTKRDALFMDKDKGVLVERIKLLLSNEYDGQFEQEFNIKDSSGFPLMRKINESEFSDTFIRQVSFRPFDKQYIYYDRTLLGRAFFNVMQHFLHDSNVGALFPRQAITEKFGFFVCDDICDINFTGVAGQYGAGLLFPLYLYTENNKQQSLGESTDRKPNLDTEIVEAIAKGLDLAFVPEKDVIPSEVEGSQDFSTSVEMTGTFAPIDLLDYIYAVLHSRTYRETYKEFLKIDFPRIPYPKDTDKFWALVKLGGELRGIHLLESPAVENYITSYPHDGDNVVTRKITKKDWELTQPCHSREDGNPPTATSSNTIDSRLEVNAEGRENTLGWRGNDEEKVRIWINDDQCFEDIPLVAWEFYIGGYQPAQKWLKDRRGRKLSFDDILHYQKIIVALTETHRIMQAIDEVGVE